MTLTYKSKTMKHIIASNFISYILDLNNFDEKEIKEVFNKCLKMHKDKRKRDFF